MPQGIKPRFFSDRQEKRAKNLQKNHKTTGGFTGTTLWSRPEVYLDLPGIPVNTALVSKLFHDGITGGAG
jgi:hypothetical protein